MKRVQGLIAVCGLSVTLTAAMAVPPVVERVPENALITLVIPSPTTLHKNLSSLATATEMAELKAMPQVDELLMMSGVGAGIDTTKSLAVVVYGPKKLDEAPAKPGAKAAEKAADHDAKGDAKKGDKPAVKPVEEEDDEDDAQAGMDRVVAILPITKYEDFLSNFGVKPAGEGKVDTFASPTGEDAFCKDIGGGYAAMGPNKELVEAFTGKPGAHSIKSRMGKAGEALSDSSDIVAIVNVDRIRSLAMKGMAEMEKQAKSQMEMMGQASQEKNLAMAKWMGETIVRDTQMVVGGLKFGSAGVSMDAVGVFKPDSYLAKAFAGTGNSSALIGKLPGGAYLWAGAMDLSTPGMKQLIKDIVGRVEVPGGEKAAKLTAANMENSEGNAISVGFPIGGAFAGLLTSTVQFTAAKDPAAALKGFKDSLAAMDGQKIETLTYHSKYIENASKAGEVSIDAWETKFEAAEGEEMPAGMTQAMPFMFGPQGMPVGYVAKGQGGIYSTYAKNTELMTKALNASNGDNLSADPMLKQSQEMLPKNRMAEMYIGTKGILDLALPFAAMTGMTVPADKIPEKLPPIAGALSTQDGALRFTIMVPTPVIKTGVFLGTEGYKSMQDRLENTAPKAKPDKGTGQPKF
jgi:hypothetical protein